MLIRRFIAAFLVLASFSGRAYAGCICPMALGSAPPPCCQTPTDTSACTDIGNPSSCGLHASADSAMVGAGAKSGRQPSLPHHPFDPPVIAASAYRWATAALPAASAADLRRARQHHSVPLYLETARLRL